MTHVAVALRFARLFALLPVASELSEVEGVWATLLTRGWNKSPDGVDVRLVVPRVAVELSPNAHCKQPVRMKTIYCTCNCLEYVLMINSVALTVCLIGRLCTCC